MKTKPPKDMMTVAVLRRVLSELPEGSDDWPIVVLVPDGSVITPGAIGVFDCQKHGTALAFDLRAHKK